MEGYFVFSLFFLLHLYIPLYFEGDPDDDHSFLLLPAYEGFAIYIRDHNASAITDHVSVSMCICPFICVRRYHYVVYDVEGSSNADFQRDGTFEFDQSVVNFIDRRRRQCQSGSVSHNTLPLILTKIHNPLFQRCRDY